MDRLGGRGGIALRLLALRASLNLLIYLLKSPFFFSLDLKTY